MDYLNYFTGKRCLFVKTKEFMSGIHKVELYVLGYFVVKNITEDCLQWFPLKTSFKSIVLINSRYLLCLCLLFSRCGP